MRAQHTPGPWTFHKSRGLNSYEIKSADGAYLADVWGVDTPVPNGVQPGAVHCNARLIAKAPELLALAQLVAEHFGTDEIDPELGGDCELRDTALRLIAEIEDAPAQK